MVKSEQKYIDVDIKRKKLISTHTHMEMDEWYDVKPYIYIWNNEEGKRDSETFE